MISNNLSFKLENNSMQGTQEALLKWLSKATKLQISKTQDLQNPQYLIALAGEIPKMPSIERTEQNEKVPTWQTRYMNFKSIYAAIQAYYKNVLKSSLPVGLPSVNLLEIAKGQDKDGLITFVTIFFIASINSASQESFINIIMNLEEIYQLELMRIIKQKNLVPIEEGDQTPMMEKQQIERSKIDEYLFKIQSLAAQNQSLTQQLMSDADERSKLKEQIKKLQQENKKIKRELDEKSLQLDLKHQQEKHEQYTNNIIADSNQEVIQMLRKQLIEQQQEHLQQKRKTQQKLQIVTQQLNVALDKITELESEDMIGMSSNRKVHHQDCVSINQHKNVTQKLQMKLKSLEQKQTQLQRELLRSKYQFEELSRKYKKQEKEKQNLKVEYEKISTNRSQLILQKDAERIKLNIMQAIKEKLKSRLDEEKKNSIK